MSTLERVESTSSFPLQTDDSSLAVCGGSSSETVVDAGNVVSPFDASEPSAQQCLVENVAPSATDIPAYLLQCQGPSLSTDKPEGVADCSVLADDIADLEKQIVNFIEVPQ